ncbi:MAG: 2-amino-4-hydroxy-6-hydroxymethyldihydropteridine diphosphokinase [bacterium]|jgi:2-amino-4-hydroxy-6-hydroxymethyldihydropteridine diphosphokinase
MKEVYLGLGSNLGDRKAFIDRALAGLLRAGVTIKGVSSLYETEPVGFMDQPSFYNAVVRGVTGMGPRQLLKTVLAIEKELGRRREIRWGPRTIDIDILIYGQEVIREMDLEIPHPRLAERAFVLIPLLELAPSLSLPNGRKIADLVKTVDSSGVKRIGDLGWTLCRRAPRARPPFLEVRGWRFEVRKK